MICVTGASGTLSSEVIRQLESAKAPFRAAYFSNKKAEGTYYGGGERGYTDYLSLAQERGDEPCGCVDGTAFDAGGPCK